MNLDVFVLDSLDELRLRLSSLQPDAACDDLFSTLAWFENLHRHGIPAQERLSVFCARPLGSGALPVCLPMLSQPAGKASAFGPQWSGLSNYYSSLFAPVGHTDECNVEVCRALLRAIRRHPDHSGVIDLQPLDQDSPFFTAMRSALREEGFFADTYFCFGNWHLTVGGRSFEQYFPCVPSRIRNTIRRGRKKLDDAGNWSLRIFSGEGDDVESAIADFDEIYRRSWKVPEPFPQFVPGLIRTAARHGWLRLGVVRLADTPIAAQLWLVRGGRALIYKLAYDEEYKRFSAGSVLTAELMRHAIDVDRVDDIDYLTGDDAYKADWMSQRRERLGMVAFDPLTVRGLASAVRHGAGRLRRALRRALPRPAPETAAPAAEIASAAEQV